MAETITIPSPSVFLRASPDSPQPTSKTLDLTTEQKRPTAKKKKAAPPATRAVENAAVCKPKQSKSRNGCLTCKAKRLKCDETKPSCQQCKRRSVECGGYKKDFKWRPFEETNVATNIAKRRKASSPVLPSSCSSSEPLREDSTTFAEYFRRDGSGSIKGPNEEVSPAFSQQVFTPPEGIHPLDAKSGAVHNSPQEKHTCTDTFADIEPSINHKTEEASADVEVASSHEVSHVESFEGLDFNLPMPDMVDFEVGGFDFMPDPFSFPMSLDDLDVEDDALDLTLLPRLPPTTPDYNNWALRLASRPMSYESTTVDPMRTGLSGPFTYLYEQPFFPQTSPEMLAIRFDKLTCGILSMKDGPTENPWRTLIWPMAKQSPALYHAISAMTAFHSSRDVPALRLLGHEHKSASIQILATGINEGSMNHDTAIATTLALAFAECWDQHITSGNDHIKGARVMMNYALVRHQAKNLKGIELARLKFLCNAWVYLDVLARITTVDDDQSDDYDKLYCLYEESPTNPEPGDGGHSGFGIDFGMPVDARLDPLMGCASTLFPLIGRTANLVRRIYHSQSNSPAVVSQGMELKLLLETWDPPEFIEPPEDPTSSVQHSIQTAEAYRWATLLYLHQALPEIPGDSSADMAKKVLVYLATVPLASRTVIVHIYPLMMAGCEATADEDRQWVKDRWAALSQRMRIGPVDRCLEVTREVWRRRDDYEYSSVRSRPLISTASNDGRRGSYEDFRDGSDVRFQPQGVGRRMTTNDIGQLESSVTSHVQRQRQRQLQRASLNGGMDPAYGVKGRLHWIGVMMDWGWEVLLG